MGEPAAGLRHARTPSRRTSAPRPRWWLAVVAVAALALLAGQAPAPASADDMTTVLKRIEDLNRAIQVSRQNTARYQRATRQYESAVAAANDRIAELAQQEQDARTQVDAVAAEIGIAEQQLALVSLQLDETTSYVSALDAQIDEGTKQLARREELYGQHLRQLYRQSQVTPLEMLLSSRDLADFAQRVQQMMLVARQDQELAAAIDALRAANQDKRVTAELKRQEIEGLKAAVTRQRDGLGAQKAYLQQLMEEAAAGQTASAAQRQYLAGAAVNASAAAQAEQARAQELQRQREAAEQLYSQLAAQVSGRFGLNQPWPGGKLALWPVRGVITSYFGPRCFPLYGRNYCDFHTGLDIAAPMYTPVRAAAAGVVQYVGYEPYGAMIVIIGHYSNFQTEYVHLDNRAHPPIVSAGQVVNAGQVVAYVGMTGLTTGPHLHFMTILNRTPVNPLPYLP